MPLAPEMSGGTYERVLATWEVGALIIDLDYLSTSNQLFMAVSSGGGTEGWLHAYNGHETCLVERMPGITEVAVDWYTNNIYWTAGS